MTSLACSAPSAIGPGAVLRRGTQRRTPFSQHSACNIVFFPHNAALHTGFLMLCRSAGDQEYQRRSSRRRAAVEEQELSLCFMVFNVVLAEACVLMLPADIYVGVCFMCCCFHQSVLMAVEGLVRCLLQDSAMQRVKSFCLQQGVFHLLRKSAGDSSKHVLAASLNAFDKMEENYSYMLRYS